MIPAEKATGEYLLYIGALGRRPFRQRVTIKSPDSTAVVDAKLAAVVTNLAAVQVRATHPRPPRSLGGDNGPVTPVDGLNRRVDGVVNSLPPELQGNFDAMATLIPGLAVTSNGISAFGMGGDANMTTLNGMSVGAASVPRDVPVTTTFLTSPWDPTRGGFAGALTSATVASGDNVSTRRVRATVDAPALQADDPIAARFGQKYTNLQLGDAGTGAFSLDKYFYDYGFQASRQTADVQSLLALDADALLHAGISPDSAFRLTQILGAQHIPVTRGGIPSQRTTTSANFIERFDRRLPAPPAGATPAPAWNVLVGADYTETSAGSLSPTVLPATTGKNVNGGGFLQGLYSRYFGTYGSYINETATAFSYRDTRGTPYLALPSGNVLIASSVAGSDPTIGSLSFGGNSALARDTRTWSWEVNNQTNFLVHDNLSFPGKLYFQSRYEHYDQSLAANRLGSFSFNSLADVADNTPSAFSRTLNMPDRSGGEWIGAAAAGGSWSATHWILAGGARSRRQCLHGIADGESRARADVRRPQRPRTEFDRGEPPLRVQLVSDGAEGVVFVRLEPVHDVSRGIPDSRRGRRVPRVPPVVAALRRDRHDGSARKQRTIGVHGTGGADPGLAVVHDRSVERADDVRRRRVRVRRYRAERLGDRPPVPPEHRMARDARVDEHGQEQLHRDRRRLFAQPRPTGHARSQFRRRAAIHAAGGGRPAGLRLAHEHRAVDRKRVGGRVARVGGIRARGGPRVGSARRRAADHGVRHPEHPVPVRDRDHRLYVHGRAQPVARLRRQRRARSTRDRVVVAGVHAAPSGDRCRPRESSSAEKIGLTAAGRVQSGLRYTPFVAGDINGDGSSNDRAFIFDPTRVADTAVSRGLRDLLNGGSASARDCLSRQINTIAGRNSCVGPWSATFNAALVIPRLPKTNGRMQATLNLANPLGGLDQLLHGSDKLHGWGSTPLVDGTLYQVRGFDPATRQFVYQVNPRFGSTNPSTSTLRSPFRITLDIRYDYGRNGEEQRLDLNLRIKPPLVGTRASADTIKTRYLRSGFTDLYAVMLRFADSLALTRAQMEQIQGEQKVLLAKADTIYAVTGGLSRRATSELRSERSRQACDGGERFGVEDHLRRVTVHQTHLGAASVAAFAGPDLRDDDDGKPTDEILLRILAAV